MAEDWGLPPAQEASTAPVTIMLPLDFANSASPEQLAAVLRAAENAAAAEIGRIERAGQYDPKISADL